MGKDLWELESDIFTDYIGTVTEASFKFNEYGGQFSLTLDEIDGREQATWENYKLPPGWESNDGGETIERVVGDEKGITKSSQFGKFLASVAGCKGAREAVGDDAPTNAAAWIGTRWHFEVTDLGKGGNSYKFTNDKGEEVVGKTKDKNYPTEFLGKESVGEGGSSAPTSSSVNGNGKVDQLSVLNDLNNPDLAMSIRNSAATLPYNEWFANSYAAIQTAQVDPKSIPDLLNAMAGRGLYEGLGGKG